MIEFITVIVELLIFYNIFPLLCAMLHMKEKGRNKSFLEKITNI